MTAIWLYACFLLVVCGVIYCGGDHWWLGTAIMFAPKWPFAVPLGVLVIWSLTAKAKDLSWLGLVFSAAVLLLPIAGVCLPWRTWMHAQNHRVTVLTCNTGRGKCHKEQLRNVITRTRPDIVCLNECRADLEEVFGDDWYVHRAGDLLIATRDSAERVAVFDRQTPNRWPRPICQILKVAHPVEPFYLATVHFLSPREGLSQITSARTVLAPSKRDELMLQTAQRREEQQRISAPIAKLRGPLIIAGDFNTPVSSRIYRKCWSQFRNAFSEAGWGLGRTVRIHHGGLAFSARVDHILASQHWRCDRCWLGPDVGSDHLPLIAHFSAL